MFGGGFSATKLKLNLKLATTRLGMLQKKQENMGQVSRREIAKLLERGKDELARIKTEQIIRDDYMLEIYELMEMYTTLLGARFGMIENVKHCDEGIMEAVCTIIWATPRLEGQVAEFKAIYQQLQNRYGKEFVEEALENRNNVVNSRVVSKMSIHQPQASLVDAYLRTIADKYKIDWKPVAALPGPPPATEDLLQFENGPGVPSGMKPLMPQQPSDFLPFNNSNHNINNNNNNNPYPPGSGSGSGNNAYPPYSPSAGTSYPPSQPYPSSNPYPPPGSQSAPAYPPADSKPPPAQAPGYTPSASGKPSYNSGGYAPSYSSSGMTEKPPFETSGPQYDSGAPSSYNPPGTSSYNPPPPANTQNSYQPPSPSFPTPPASSTPSTDIGGLLDLPTIPSSSPGGGAPGPSGGDAGAVSGSFDYDDLTRRFNDLKKR